MGTRGLFGFCYNGKYYLMYNHFDSYPYGLGYKLIKQIRTDITNGTFDSWQQKASMLQVVDMDGDRKPTEPEITRLAPYTSLNVSRQSTEDWYCLLRGTQGNLDKILDSGFVLHGSLDWSSEAEYIYVINLDTSQFEVHYDEDHISYYPLDFLPEDNIFDYEGGEEEYRKALREHQVTGVCN